MFATQWDESEQAERTWQRSYYCIDSNATVAGPNIR